MSDLPDRKPEVGDVWRTDLGEERVIAVHAFPEGDAQAVLAAERDCPFRVVYLKNGTDLRAWTLLEPASPAAPSAEVTIPVVVRGAVSRAWVDRLGAAVGDAAEEFVQREPPGVDYAVDVQRAVVEAGDTTKGGAPAKEVSNGEDE